MPSAEGLLEGGIQYMHSQCKKRLNGKLERASLVMRAQSYRRRLFSEFDRAKQVFLP